MDKSDFFNRAKKVKAITLDDGTEMHVKKLSQGDLETIKTKYSGENDAASFRYIVCRCVVDVDGVRVFNDGDLAKLIDMDFNDAQHIAAEVLEFSGLTKADAKND